MSKDETKPDDHTHLIAGITDELCAQLDDLSKQMRAYHADTIAHLRALPGFKPIGRDREEADAKLKEELDQLARGRRE